ncbi:RNA-directed DNA polymerase, eukaryota, reverse transcriptase zinc-binding domain protein [Tanacetum coccineum]
MKKLDRAMVNAEFLGSYGGAHARFHPFLISDHSPVVIHIPDTLEGTKKAFTFSNFITDKKEIIEVVKKEWNCDCDGYSMYKMLEEDLKKAQVKVEANPNNDDVKKDMSTFLQEYNEAINDEEKLLAQNAKVKWLSEGDKNTKYFHNVVKSRRNLNRIMDSEEIDSEGLFNKKLTRSEAEDMVRDVSDTKIKEAIFGIGNDKAPGPDGFTATFFKKSWNIVGEDVCKAVKEFFKSNKLLGEVNATLITLVPKIHHPKKVSEYSPIACCNVIYKCINNLLITQELLKGYNRKKGPQRCALKIDIAKQAYDTGCKEIKLTQLCFADDLLMLCNGDYKSVEVLKYGLMEFSKASGLVLNMNKSTIFFGSVMEIEIRKILEVMPFTVGNLPMKYLGVPLINKNIGISECNQLVERVKQKVNDWKNKALSYAGRLQLIASILASMHIYWASVFLILKTNVREIEKALKGFLSCQGDMKKGTAKVSWKVICRPKSQGGLGIKSLGPRNEALLCKHLWNVITQKDSLWVKWVNMAKLRGKSIWEVEIDDNDSGT